MGVPIQLLDVPNELLSKIIEMIPPLEGLEEFTRCSRVLFVLGQNALKKHRRLKTKYSVQKFQSSTHNHGAFYDILTDETIALYFTRLVVGEYILRGYVDLLQIACVIGDCKFIDEVRKYYKAEHLETGLTDLHQDLIFDFNVDVIGIMLASFPNLRTIDFDTLLGTRPSIKLMFSEMSSSTRIEAGKEHPWERLAAVSLSRNNNGICLGLYKVYRVFASLPSTRSLAGEGIDGQECSWGLRSDGNIQSLSFKRSCIDIQSFNSILRLSNELQDFTYTYESLTSLLLRGAPHKCPDYDPTNRNDILWAPRYVLSSLLGYAYGTLTSLNLSFHGRPCFASWSNDHCYDCLQGFCVLKKIRMDHTMFIRGNGEEADWQGSRTELKRGEVHRLVDTLPTSAEDITFAPGCRQKTANKLLKGLPTSEWRTLSKLKRVEFERDGPGYQVVIDKETKETCRNAGVRLLWGGKDL